MIQLPFLSVLMTAYNREKYIAEAIESVLASTYTNFELIIVDDCSLDQTYIIAKTFAEKDNRIRLVKNEFNLGQFKNRNYAASLAKGTYLKYLDSDDKITNDGLEIMIECMLKFPESGVGSECHSKDTKQLPRLFSSRECYVNHYFRGTTLLYVGPSGSIFKKETFKKVGGFDETIGILADTLFMLKLAAITPVVGLPKNLCYWRTHDGQQINIIQKKTFELILEHYLVTKTALESPYCPFSLKEKEILFRNLKNIFIRRILTKKDLSFKRILELAKLQGINAFDVFLAAIPNKKIES